MATIEPGTRVALRQQYRELLAYPPDLAAELEVAVHPGALGAPRHGLTEVAGRTDDRITWVGSIDEAMLDVIAPGTAVARSELAWFLARGVRLWEVVLPGPLTTAAAPAPLFTVYSGSRPWVVVGELEGGDVLAAPLNSAISELWFTPVLEAGDMDFGDGRRALVELAHLWSFPNPPGAGRVLPAGQRRITEKLAAYFS